jgi:hypothetical protein
VPDRDHSLQGEEGVGQLLDLLARRPGGEAVGDRLDRLAAVEVGGVFGQGRLDRCDLHPALGYLALLAHRRPDRLTIKADLLRFGAPALAQALLADVAFLGRAGRQGGDPAGAHRGVGGAGRKDLCPAGGEGAQMLGIEALDLGDAVAERAPVDPEALGQLVAQVGLIDVAGGLGLVIDRRVVEAGPAPVRALVALATKTWVWSWGSPALEERWV